MTMTKSTRTVIARARWSLTILLGSVLLATAAVALGLSMLLPSVIREAKR